MKKKLQNYQLADFALRTRFEDINAQNLDLLKKHLLDSLGSLIFSTNKPTINKLRRQILKLADGGRCRVPGILSLPLDRAAQFYTALIRYPDFMDNYLGKEATCHPSDNIGALLAVSQLRKTTGKEFITAMAIAYEIECRLVEEIPVMKEGIDHTLFLSYSIVSSVAKMLELSREQIANALGIAGSSISPMVTSRASYTSEWKGFASSLEAMICMNTVLLAKENMTGPVALFEGPKGFQEIFKMKLDFDWRQEDFSLLKKCILKPHNAEVHTQSAIEAILELRKSNAFSVNDVKRIVVTTFLTAYHITGSGSYGDRKEVRTKEQADHSLFYVLAVALLDGEVYPEQYSRHRINSDDVQELLKKIHVQTILPFREPVVIAGLLDPFTQAYPKKVKSKIIIHLNDGKKIECEKEDHPGFFTKPLSWENTEAKFRRLCVDIISNAVQDEVIDIVRTIENSDLNKLLNLLNTINTRSPELRLTKSHFNL